MSSVSNGIDPLASEKVSRLVTPESGVHAVLLYGAEGAPLEETAMLLAKGWLCTGTAEMRPCGECRSCLTFEKGNHVDLKRISSGGAGNFIRIGQITPRPDEKDLPDISLQEFFRTPALMSNRKVTIIEDADRLISNAANSLLKILEEPHPYAKLILTTRYLSSLLPTILSRCVSIPVERSTVSPSESFERIGAFARSLKGKRKRDALALSEEFKKLCVADDEGSSKARIAQAKALSTLATCLLTSNVLPPESVQMVIEAHRRILGNGGATLVFDALFASLTE